MFRFLQSTRVVVHSTPSLLSRHHVAATLLPVQLRWLSSKSQPIITPSLVREHRLKSLAGIAPINTEGEMALQDVSETESKQTRKSPDTSAAASAPTPDSPPHLPYARSLHPSEADDLTRPPRLPKSTTHTTFAPDVNQLKYDQLAEKSPWRGGPKRSKKEEQQTEEGDAAAAATPGFESLKRVLPSVGWAQARTKDTANGDNSESTSGRWSDEDFLLIFPHLRYIRSKEFDHITNTYPVASPKVLATPEQLQEIIREVRERCPEFEKLHLGSTYIKVKKWRELLGATRLANEATVDPSQSSPPVAPTTVEPRPDLLPPSFPANALHPRYYQTDLFMTKEEVSILLMKERDLLYLTIEQAVVPRLQILRSHLPGINLTSVLHRNPQILLSDLHVALPLKLKELRALFPDLNLTAFIEKDARILNHAASSYIVPRLNLVQNVTQYQPQHVVQFLTIEYPQLLQMRWNRVKRIEIVKEPQFWEWYRNTTNPQQSESSTTSSPDSTATPTVGDPASLPFSVYADLVLQTQESFKATFPWFNLKFSPLEQELFAAQRNRREARAAEQTTTTGTPSIASINNATILENNSTKNLPASLLASVPGNPQPLSQALGLTPESTLTADEIRAKKRMDYLALKQAKLEQKQNSRFMMAEREAEHQRKKLQQYTEKFQQVRARSGLIARDDEPELATPSSYSPPPPMNNDPDSSGRSFNSGSNDRGARRRGRQETYSNVRYGSAGPPAPEVDTYVPPVYSPQNDPSYSSRDRRGGGGYRGGNNDRSNDRPAYRHRDDDGGERGSAHKKNRAGPMAFERHSSHDQGKVESFNPNTTSSFSSSSSYANRDSFEQPRVNDYDSGRNSSYSSSYDRARSSSSYDSHRGSGRSYSSNNRNDRSNSSWGPKSDSSSSSSYNRGSSGGRGGYGGDRSANRGGGRGEYGGERRSFNRDSSDRSDRR